MEPIVGLLGAQTIAELAKSLANTEVKNLLEELSKQTNQESESRRLPTEQRRENLRSAYVNGRLVLVLGAGVSMSHGLPDWNTLLQQLILRTTADEGRDHSDEYLLVAQLFNQIFRPSPLIAARYLRLRLGEEFDKAVHEVVYEDLDLQKSSELLDEIRQLCVSPGRNPNLNAVITYNYDDLLETYLENLQIKVPYKSIYAVGMNPDPDELPIYHIHGYLPVRPELAPENKVTLSEDIYHEQYADIYSWNNIVQINKFRDYTCLFIGTSFTDPNLRRVLDIAAQQRGPDRAIQHYIVRPRHRTEQVQSQINKVLETNKDMLDERQRANLRLERTAENLVELMRNFDEEDARSFGVETVWVEDYEEIPKVLREVQNRS